MNVGNFGIALQPPGVVHVDRHCVDAMKRSPGMGCRKNSRGYAGAAAQIAPCEGAIADRRLESGHERDVVEPRWRCLTNEVPGVSNV
jgi:hypothetical protein